MVGFPNRRYGRVHGSFWCVGGPHRGFGGQNGFGGFEGAHVSMRGLVLPLMYYGPLGFGPHHDGLLYGPVIRGMVSPYPFYGLPYIYDYECSLYYDYGYNFFFWAKYQASEISNWENIFDNFICFLILLKYYLHFFEE